MGDWFASGLALDMILAAILLEGFMLAWLSKRRDQGYLFWLPNLLAGAALVLALRLLVAGVAWSWIAAVLGLALLSHAVDLIQRFEPRR